MHIIAYGDVYTIHIVAVVCMSILPINFRHYAMAFSFQVSLYCLSQA